MRGNAPSSDASSMSRTSWAILGLVAATIVVVGAVAAGGFDDDEGTVHEPAIEALAERGVLAGTDCGSGLICPGEPIRRWVMAVWLIRALGESPSEAPSRFADVGPDAWWAPYVERLAELRVTEGCATGPDRYCPHNPVTRAQMASFLVRAFDLAPGPAAGFADTATNHHAASIDALATSRITAGCGTEPARYCPDALVTRGQLATFLARALGIVPLPERSGTAPVTGFTTVSVGERHACAIRMDETVECWGGSYSQQSDAPWGWFTSVSAGREHTCGIRTDRTISCWGGSNQHGQADPPAGRFAAVAAGWRHSCGLRVNGRVTCWGYDEDGQVAAPGGEFTAVSVGRTGSCGLRTDRTITCWGLGSSFKPDPPDGEFTALYSDEHR